MTFFDPVTSEPRVWFYKGEDGIFELFDSSGYHPQYKTKLEPITPDVVVQIKDQLKTGAERIIQEEQRKREEAERIAKQKQEEARKNDEPKGAKSQEKRTPQGGVKLPFD